MDKSARLAFALASILALIGCGYSAPSESQEIANGAGGGAARDVTIAIAGPNELVIPTDAFSCSKPDSSTDGAQAADVPDAPPRLLRRADGQFEMMAAHHNNIPFYSTDGVHFAHHGCQSALPSSQDANPADFADQDWLVGFYTLNGRDVYALLHDEYHGPAHIPACKSRLLPGQNYWASTCLSVSLTGAVSHDMGSTFQFMPGDLHLVATTPDRITRDNINSLTSMGVRDPSNIVRNPLDGYAYFVALVVAHGAQPAGVCLFRSHDPLTQPWMAWDGSGFQHSMSSPYVANGGDAGTICAPVFGNGDSVEALSYNTVAHKFIAIVQSNTHTLFATTSDNLIEWSPQQRLRVSLQPQWWRPNQADPDPEFYFSIIDPTSKSRFFDTSGAHPYIYYVHWNVGPKGVESRQRDIMRVPLDISAQ